MNSASWCSMKGRRVDNFSSWSILSFSEFSTVIPRQIRVTCSGYHVWWLCRCCQTRNRARIWWVSIGVQCEPRVFDANKVPEHTVSWARDVSIIVIPDVNWRLHAERILKGCIAEQQSSLRVSLLSAFTRENDDVTEQQERVTAIGRLRVSVCTRVLVERGFQHQVATNSVECIPHIVDLENDVIQVRYLSQLSHLMCRSLSTMLHTVAQLYGTILLTIFTYTYLSGQCSFFLVLPAEKYFIS